MLADDPEGRAEALLARPAELAGRAVEAGLHENAIAGRQARHALPRPVDDAGGIRSRDLRKRHVGNSVAHEDVEMVEGRGADGDAHLARTGLGRRPVAVVEDLEAPGLFEKDRLHHFKYPSDRSFSRYSRSLSGAGLDGGAMRGP